MPRNLITETPSEIQVQYIDSITANDQQDYRDIINEQAQEQAVAGIQSLASVFIDEAPEGQTVTRRWDSRRPSIDSHPRPRQIRPRTREEERAHNERIALRQQQEYMRIAQQGLRVPEWRQVEGVPEGERVQIMLTPTGPVFTNPSVRVAGQAPKPPITSYTIMKKLIKYTSEYTTATHNETFRLIIKAVTSVSIKRYGQQFTEESNIDLSRKRIQKWIAKNTGVEFIQDDINGWALIHPDRVHQLHSDKGLLNVDRITFEEVAQHCQINGEAWLSYDMIQVSDRGLISPTAYDELGYWYCDNCTNHRPFHEENCGHCARRGSDVEIGRLYGYNDNVRDFIPTLFDTPAREFLVEGKVVRQRKGRKTDGSTRKQPKPKLYFGLELEVVPREGVSQKDALYWVSSVMKNYALMKSDASLAAGGFEIVTAPATLDFHRKKLWHDFFNLKLPSGKTASQMVKSWNTTCCGLHIHFTRAAAAEVQLSKMLVFYHSRLNSRFLGDIAGRLIGPGAAYCHQKEKKLHAVKDKKTNKVVRTTVDDCHEHHDAITISKRNNGKTVEVRIFRGNASLHGIMRALDFVAATLEWSAVAGINQNNEDLRYIKFLEWFDESSNRSRFPDLWKHLISLGYLGTRHKSKNKKVLDDLPSELKAA